ncbi:MAG: exodeoxyribonuclease VII large subunit [Acidobacteria bacterium]|nr:exodeoxyribonuclease VII large subunit [Acidobacteriota bacterium]MYD70048.1 exodeoxyribonuclease VII large subunit [Acidobacteriota bacterium]MYJ05548.1 exodeoxyribonuclease VII large subunit [Acidobacteriota bacterium]
MTERLPFDDAAPAPSIAPAAASRPRRQVLTVSQLTTQIRRKLESAYPTVWVEGELSNVRPWRTGHVYFTLKDGNAQIRGVMFRSAVHTLRFEPEDGLHVVARGRVTVYEPKGEYQLVAEHFEPAGVGARQLAFDQLRQRLEREGLFAAERKRALPMLPRRIGVVTSLDGAALRDILTVLRRRFPTAQVVISPARVQGDGAAAELVGALNRLARVSRLDVVIVGRGGGSTEDLWEFNDERLARAIAACPVPVISAVGHETDFTITDFVADIRAPTPSAAAEIVVARKVDLDGRVARGADRLVQAARDAARRRRDLVERARTSPGMASWPARITLRHRQVEELTDRLGDGARDLISERARQTRVLRQRLDQLDVGVRLARVRAALALAAERLAGAAEGRAASGRRRLERVAAQLAALSPLAVLARGYAVCWNDDRTAIVRRARDVRAGETVRVTLHEGELRCGVREISEGAQHG